MPLIAFEADTLQLTESHSEDLLTDALDTSAEGLIQLKEHL
jgi:hypothetical protein